MIVHERFMNAEFDLGCDGRKYGGMGRFGLKEPSCTPLIIKE